MPEYVFCNKNYDKYDKYYDKNYDKNYNTNYDTNKDNNYDKKIMPEYGSHYLRLKFLIEFLIIYKKHSLEVFFTTTPITKSRV